MAARGIEVTVHPATATAEQLLAGGPDGVFFSNGPGDPAAADYAVAAASGVLDAGVPLFGICFGNQVLGRALGFGTYKLGYGHRGINQPVQDRATGRVAVTSHNHGFAVDAPIDRSAKLLTAAWKSATSRSTTVSSKGCDCSTGRRSRCSTTPKPRPGHTTPTGCSTASSP